MKVKAYITVQAALDIADGQKKPFKITPHKNTVSCVEITFEHPSSWFGEKKEGSDK